MTLADLPALLPIIVVAAAAVVVMLAAAFCRSHVLAVALTVIGLVAALAALPLAAGHGPRQITPLLLVDRYTIFYTGLIAAATLAATLLGYDYWKSRTQRQEEFYVLLLLATLGSFVLVSSSHFASLFLGLEILSVALYGLIAYQWTSPNGIEAGLKYLVLAATSAAFLLFGMALIYAESGTLGFAQLAAWRVPHASSVLVVSAGLALMVVGIGFKLAVVPFHLWTPDVYQGAPAPVTAFIATASKGAMFAVLLRLFRQLGAEPSDNVFLLFAAIAAASMFAGNLLALLQDNVKRMLAYSSIAHLGYLLVAFLAGGRQAADFLGGGSRADAAVAYYLTAYFITTLGAFGVVAVLSPPDRDADLRSDYQGLAWRRPWLAAVMAAMLLSLAGIPLTAGFVGKFYLLLAGVQSRLWWLVGILVVNSAIGLFYYLRLLIAMFAAEPEIVVPADAEVPRGTAVAGTPLLAGLTLFVLTVLLIWLGISPAGLLQAVASITAIGY
jgi:NADH-quinone oxidoreductase subunit N